MTPGLRSLRIRGLRRFEDVRVAFGEGTTFLEGENNAGKTSVFYAIEYALFGRIGLLGAPALAHPGTRHVGVEVVFVGRDGRRYRLQRLHLRSPRGRGTWLGHFTLKVADSEDEDERYVVSSDFGDREDQLSAALTAGLGVSRRAWELAVHPKQGSIPDILEGGAHQLDVVLGVTAARFVEEELRMMAYEREKAAAQLPALAAALAVHEADRQRRRDQLGRLEAVRADLSDRASALQRREAELAADRVALDALKGAVDALDAAELALRDAEAEEARRTSARDGAGDPTALATAVDAARARVTALSTDRDADRSQVAGLREAARALDRERGALASRLERRRSLGAVCDACGQPVDAEHVAREVPALAAALGEVDARLAEAERALAEGMGAADERQEALATARTAERDAQRAVDARQRSGDEADQACARAAAARERAAVARREAEARTAGADPRLAHGTRRDELHARTVRLEADRDHVAEQTARLEADLAGGATAVAEVERAIAGASARIRELDREEAVLARLRALVKGMKGVQLALREEASAKIAGRALEIHRHLAGDDRELAALTIDPARYAVLVTPHDVGSEVPAASAQGGGHRLLLGLSVRLALAEHLGPVPFVLLDEPTYGLDTARREALLARIASIRVAGQLVVITHHAVSAAGGHRVRIVRDGTRSVVEGDSAP